MEEKRKRGRSMGPKTIPISIRLTEIQHSAYIERGGARWIKRLINEQIERVTEIKRFGTKAEKFGEEACNRENAG